MTITEPNLVNGQAYYDLNFTNADNEAKFEQGGLEYWANLRQAGVSEQQIISSFLNSPEGQKALGQFDTQR
ncbi:MAG: hypothetical protein WC184_00005, partial [Acidimicrobiia bacterium]